MNLFLDSSALIKLYHAERGSSRVKALMARVDCRIVISRLAGVEVHSALALKVRTGQLSREAAAGLRLRFLGDLASGLMRVLAIGEAHFATAEDLIIRHADNKGLRALDALHLAVALDVRARVGLEAFVVADAALAAVAQAEGLAILNPESGSDNRPSRAE